jgi:uncharacterized Zn finger protein (UPF0148 family)
MERKDIEKILTGNPEQWYVAELSPAMRAYAKGCYIDIEIVRDRAGLSVAHISHIASLRPVGGPPVEEECEWRDDYEGQTWYVQCRDVLLVDMDPCDVTGWTYCPYCGKRMRFTEPAAEPCTNEKLQQIQEQAKGLDMDGLIETLARPSFADRLAKLEGQIERAVGEIARVAADLARMERTQDVLWRKVEDIE